MSKCGLVRTSKAADVKREPDDNWRPNPRPHAFFVPLYMCEDQAALVDPTEPLTHGCWVVVRLEGSYLQGTLFTKHPARAKTLAVQIGDGVLRGNEKADVIRIVSVSRSI
jgi:hypothetical protein